MVGTYQAVKTTVAPEETGNETLQHLWAHKLRQMDELK